MLGCATMAAAVPPAELAMVSTRSAREVLFDSGSVEVVLVVSGRCHDKEAVGKVGAVLEISDDMRDQCVEVSCDKPVNLCLSVPQDKLESWWSVGDASRREAAKFPQVIYFPA